MNRRIIVPLLMAAAATLALGATSYASHAKTQTRFKANLNARSEVPAPKNVPRLAGGSFSATLSGTSLSWKLTFKHLTGSATAAHIHLGAKGKPGPVLVPLCGPCSSGASGTAKVTSAIASQMSSGKTYVNVHTVKNPGGEIRGQIGR